MRSVFFRALLFTVILSFVFPSSIPAYALRQTGLEENEKLRDQLAQALQDQDDPLSAVAHTVASGVSRFLGSPAAVPPLAAAGMEEVDWNWEEVRRLVKVAGQRLQDLPRPQRPQALSRLEELLKAERPNVQSARLALSQAIEAIRAVRGVRAFVHIHPLEEAQRLLDPLEIIARRNVLPKEARTFVMDLVREGKVTEVRRGQNVLKGVTLTPESVEREASQINPDFGWLRMSVDLAQKVADLLPPVHIKGLEKRSGMEEAPIRPVDVETWRGAPLVQLMRTWESPAGVAIYGNVFFHDGLWAEDAAMYPSFEADGASSTTTNQSIVGKKAPLWRQRVMEMIAQGLPDEEIFLRAYYSEARRPAQALAPLRDLSGGVFGQTSQEASALITELNPLLEGMRQIDALHGTTALLTKLPYIAGVVPAASVHEEAGAQAIEQRVADGRSGNITLGFSVQQYLAAARAHIRGLQARVARMRDELGDVPGVDLYAVIRNDLAGINWVFSLFMSRIDRRLAPWFDEAIQQAQQAEDTERARELKMLKGKTSVALGRFIGQVMQYIYGITDQFSDEAGFLSGDEHLLIQELRGDFAALHAAYGARPLYLLIASSGKYAEQDYATELQYFLPFLDIGVQNTLPPDTLRRAREFAERVLAGQAGISLEELRSRHFIQETIPMAEQPDPNWDPLILMTAEQRSARGVESRSASWLAKRTEQVLLAGRASAAEQTLLGVGKERRDAGAADFANEERKMLALIAGWRQEYERVELLAKLSWYNRFKDWQIIYRAGSGHPGGTLSAAEILTTLYDPEVMRYNPRDRGIRPEERWLNRDRLVLSKGHAVPMQYVALYNAGILTRAEIEDLRKDARNLAQGHATLSTTPGIDFSTGALGYGAPAAAGMAVAAKLDGRDFHTFTVIGDGEMEKGPIYEMAQTASTLGLDNLTAVVDYNQYQQNKPRADYTPLNYAKLAEWWRLHNWNVVTIDGENMDQSQQLRYIDELKQALLRSKTQKNGKPTVILVRTIKGMGISFVEGAFRQGDMSFHGKAPTPEQYEAGVREIAKRLFRVGTEVALPDLEGDLDSFGAHLITQSRSRQLSPQQIAEIDRRTATAVQEAKAKRLAARPEPAPAYAPGGKPVATREAAGAMWTYLGSLQRPVGDQDPTKIVLVSPSDLQDSGSFVQFGKVHGKFSPSAPQGRLVEMGIMEDAGIKIAEGIAAAGLGYLPVVGTFDRFSQIFLDAMDHTADDRLRLVIHATHAGTETGPDGPSQYSTNTPAAVYALTERGERLAMFEPSDALTTVEAVEQAVKAGKLAYLRLGRSPRPTLERRGAKLYPGSGVIVRRDPSATEGGRVLLVASGATVARAVEASELLEKEKIGAKVIEITSVTQADDVTRDNAFLQELEPRVPVYVIHDASLKALQAPITQVINAAASTLGIFPQLRDNRVFFRGITVKGSGSTENLFGHNRFLGPLIAEDAKALIAASAKLERGQFAAIPEGIEPRLFAGMEEVATGLAIQPDIARDYSDLFGTRTINGRNLSVEGLIAGLARRLEPEFSGRLAERARFLNQVAAGRARYGFADPNQKFEDADGNRWTVGQIRQGMSDNFFGRTSEHAWRLNERVSVPEEATRPGLQGTGPWGDMGMAMNAVNAGAYGAVSWMADWEDARPGKGRELFQAWRNAGKIHAGEADVYWHPEKKKAYSINIPEERRPTVFHRVSGIHLKSGRMTLDGKPIPAIIHDLAIPALNFHSSVKDERGRGLYFYVPKIETPQEALVVAKLLKSLEEEMNLPRGTIKIEMLNERARYSANQEVIMWVLRHWLIGPNVGRWDYLNSRIEMLKDSPEGVFPDPHTITMTDPTMTEYTRRNAILALLVNGFPIGGMSAVMENPSASAEVNDKAIRSIWFDKLRERLTGMLVMNGKLHDAYRQSWVATVSQKYVEAGAEPLQASYSQLQQLVKQKATSQERERLQKLGLINAQADITPYQVTQEELDNLFSPQAWDRLFRRPEGGVTEEGLRYAIYMASEYMFQLLNGNFAAAIDDYLSGNRLMNDLATYEIFWHWLRTALHHQVELTQDGKTTKKGDRVTPELMSRLLDERWQTVQDYFATTPDTGRFDRSWAPVVMEILRRQLSHPRWITYGSRVILSIYELNPQDAAGREAILQGIFGTREEALGRLKQAKDPASRALAEKTLAAHDYVYDFFPRQVASGYRAQPLATGLKLTGVPVVTSDGKVLYSVENAAPLIGVPSGIQREGSNGGVDVMDLPKAASPGPLTAQPFARGLYKPSRIIPLQSSPGVYAVQEPDGFALVGPGLNQVTQVPRLPNLFGLAELSNGRMVATQQLPPHLAVADPNHPDVHRGIDLSNADGIVTGVTAGPLSVSGERVLLGRARYEDLPDLVSVNLETNEVQTIPGVYPIHLMLYPDPALGKTVVLIASLDKLRRWDPETQTLVGAPALIPGGISTEFPPYIQPDGKVVVPGRADTLTRVTFARSPGEENRAEPLTGFHRPGTPIELVDGRLMVPEEYGVAFASFFQKEVAEDRLYLGERPIWIHPLPGGGFPFLAATSNGFYLLTRGAAGMEEFGMLISQAQGMLMGVQDEQVQDLVRQSIQLLESSTEPSVRLNGIKKAYIVDPNHTWPVVLLHWVVGGQPMEAFDLYRQVTGDLIRSVALQEGVQNPERLLQEIPGYAPELSELTRAIQRLPAFSPPRPEPPMGGTWMEDQYGAAGMEEGWRRILAVPAVVASAVVGAEAEQAEIPLLEQQQIVQAKVTFEKRKITVSNLPEELTKDITAALVAIENDNRGEKRVWYFQPKDPKGDWHFAVEKGVVTVTTQTTDEKRLFRPEHVWIILLKDGKAVTTLREQVKGLPIHKDQKEEADTYLVQSVGRPELASLLKDKKFVEPTRFVTFRIVGDEKEPAIVRLVPPKAGMEEADLKRELLSPSTTERAEDLSFATARRRYWTHPRRAEMEATVVPFLAGEFGQSEDWVREHLARGIRIASGGSPFATVTDVRVLIREVGAYRQINLRAGRPLAEVDLNVIVPGIVSTIDRNESPQGPFAQAVREILLGFDAGTSEAELAQRIWDKYGTAPGPSVPPPATGMEEVRPSRTMLLSFDLPSGPALVGSGLEQLLIVAPTPTDARHQRALGLPPEALVGLLWAGLEESDYLAVAPGMTLFVSADLMAEGWQRGVLEAVSQRSPGWRVIAIYDAGSLASGLEELGIPGVTITQVLQARSGAEDTLGKMK